MIYEQSIIGKQIGNYRITAPITTGSYGVIYRAEHQVLTGRIVAIKFLRTYLGSLRQREQFIQEARFLEHVHHPHMLAILDVGLFGNMPYIITPFASGGSLRDRLRQQNSDLLPLAETLTILTQIGQALQYAHEQGIVHRDLKPENILFNERGEALLADFGLAAMLSHGSTQQTRQLGGTPPYMAPEQFQGIISREGDQYSLACIAYELVTGRRPFSAPDLIAMGFKHMNEMPIAPSRLNSSLPPHIEKAILKALAKQRTERYPSVKAFIHALHGSTSSYTIPSTPIQTMSPVHSIPVSNGIPPVPRSALPGTFTASRMPPPATPAMQGSPAAARMSRPTPSAIPSARMNSSAAPRMPHPQISSIKSAPLGPEAASRMPPPFFPPTHISATGPGKVYPPITPSSTGVLPQQHARDRSTDHQLNMGSNMRTELHHSTQGDPRYARSHNKKGLVELQFQQYEKAFASFSQACLLDPENAEYHSNRGNALLKLRRFQEALDAFKQACRLAPKVAEYYNNCGNVFYELKKYQEAVEAYERAIVLDIEMAEYRHNCGNALFKQRKFQKALIVYEQACELAPKTAEYHNSRGNALLELSRYKEAVRAYEQAIALDPQNGLYHANAGDAYTMLGQRWQAREAHNQAKKLGYKRSN